MRMEMLFSWDRRCKIGEGRTIIQGKGDSVLEKKIQQLDYIFSSIPDINSISSITTIAFNSCDIINALANIDF